MLNEFLVEQHVKNALMEDIGFQDISTEALMQDKMVTAYLKTRVDGIFCGGQVAKKVFELLSHNVKFVFYKNDGDEMKAGDMTM